MGRLIILFFALFQITYGEAQTSLGLDLDKIQICLDNQQTDSLPWFINQVQNKYLLHDSLKTALSLFKVGYYLIEGKLDSASLGLKNISLQYDQIKDPDSLLFINILLYKTELDYRKQRFKEVLNDVDSAFRFITSIQNKNYKLAAMLYRFEGLAYHGLWDPVSSIRSTEKAIALWNQFEPENEVMIARLYNNLSIAMQDQREYDRALIYLHQSLSLLEKNLGSNNRLVAIISSNIALANIQKNNYKEALKYLEKAKLIYQTTVSPRSIVFHYMHEQLGSVALESGNYDEALIQYDSAKYYATINNRINLIANANSSIANVYKKMNHLDLAINYKQKALLLNQEHQGPFHKNTVLFHINLGELFAAKHLFNQAKEHSDLS